MNNKHLHSSSMEVITAYWAQIVSLKTLKFIVSSFIMIFSFLFGEFNIAMMACGTLYIADMICGMGIAAYKGNWNWPKLRKGVFKFILYGIAIIVGHFLDLLIMHNTVEFGAQYIIIMYLGVTEALSVLKHLANLGLHIPIKLINRLEGIKQNLDDADSGELNLGPILPPSNQ